MHDEKRNFFDIFSQMLNLPELENLAPVGQTSQRGGVPRGGHGVAADRSPQIQEGDWSLPISGRMKCT